MQRDPLSLERNGTTIKLVAQAFDSGFTLPPETQVQGTLQPLPAGKYHVEFYTRIQPNGSPGGNPADLLPEQFWDAFDFDVFAIPPTCGATTVEAIEGAFTSAAVNQAYPDTLRFKVTDAHGNPVPNYPLWVHRVKPPDELSNNDPVADVARATQSLMTGADGVASFSPAANDVPGAFQYMAEVTGIGKSSVAYFIFYNRPADSMAPRYPIVEFVRTLPDYMQHFFLTGNAPEMAKLDDTAAWQRTGAVFMTFPPGSERPGTTPVCRFYGLPSAGLDSHFFSAAPEECEAVLQRFPNSWVLETDDAFEVFLPDRNTGACPTGTRSLYRAFNNQPDANHRYALTHGIALLNAHPPNGPYWSLEGYGLDAVVMCLPQ